MQEIKKVIVATNFITFLNIHMMYYEWNSLENLMILKNQHKVLSKPNIFFFKKFTYRL